MKCKTCKYLGFEKISSHGCDYIGKVCKNKKNMYDCGDAYEDRFEYQFIDWINSDGTCKDYKKGKVKKIPKISFWGNLK